MRIASAPISSARSAAAVSVVKNGFPVPAAKITTRLLLEVADRASPDVRLGDLATPRSRTARGCARRPLERVLQRERVQERREHPGVVGRGAVHALGRGGHAAVDVPAADDDRELRPALVDRDDLLRDGDDRLRVDPVLAPAEERLARQLQETRGGTGAASARGRCATSSRAGTLRARDGDAHEPRDRRAGVGERLADRLRRLVDPRLLDERAAGVAAKKRLSSMPSTIFSRAGSGLRLHLVGVHEDRALGRENLGRARPHGSSTRRRERDVHRELARQLLVPPSSSTSTPILFAGGCA